MARIDLDQVSLTFRIRQRGKFTLKEFLVRRMYRKSVNPVITVPALQEVSLSLRDGDRLGVIGHNGAGKSTLLKLLAGIYPPSFGTRLVDGRVSSLFDISVGFEPEASGWENIAFRCYLHGENHNTVKTKRHAIADFSELGSFLEMPVRYYSAGMLVRLAFSIATSIEPEVLLVDEVLSAGDLAFQEKAALRMRELMQKAKLMVVVSHDLKNITQLCEQIAWLDHGRIKMLGPSREVVKAYTDYVHGLQNPMPLPQQQAA